VESHNHNNLQKNNRLSFEMKEEIKIQFDLNLKAKNILDKLREKGIVSVNKVQISNYLVKLRQRKYGSTKISLGELEKWCIDHSKIPVSDDKAFVVSYFADYGHDYDDEDGGNVSKFRSHVSTKRLLKIALKSKTIHADATYKLVWEGMSILIAETCDMDRHFYPFGISVCSSETTEDFIFIFQSLVAGLKNG